MIFLMITAPLQAQVDLNGKWRFKFVVESAGGECSEEVGAVTSEITTIEHNLDTGAVILKWTEDSEITAHGRVEDKQLSYTILFEQDGGWVDRSIVFTIDNENHLDGSEDWTWGYTMEDQSACPESTSKVDGYRIFEDEAVTYVPSIRSFGSEMMFLMRATPEGRRLLNLYLTHRPELFSIMLSNPEIGGRSVAMVASMAAKIPEAEGEIPSPVEVDGEVRKTYDALKSSVAAVLANAGSGPLIDQPMVDRMAGLAELFEAEASPELASVIQIESARLNEFQDLLGNGVDELATLAGVDLESVVVRVFDASLEGDRFSIEVSQVEGLRFELWKSKTLQAESWSQVEDAEITTADGLVTLTDPSPGSGSCFYRAFRLLPD